MASSRFARWIWLVVLVPTLCGPSHGADDPQGDAVEALGTGGPLFDLASVTASAESKTLEIEVTFFGDVSSPTSGLPSAVFGFLELDTDQDPATGVAPIQNTFAPPLPQSPLGIERLINLSAPGAVPGTIDILDGAFNFIGSGTAVYKNNSISVSIPIEFIGGEAFVDIAATFGSLSQPTDALDDPTSSVEATPILRGDCDANSQLDLSDVVRALDYLCCGGEVPACLDACDVNDDGLLDVCDAVIELAYLFTEGPPPAAPFPGCGPDSGDDALNCESDEGCTT